MSDVNTIDGVRFGPEAEPIVKEYLGLCHAMQTGVEFSRDKTSQQPKHLRVGVNTAMCDHSALAKLLVTKGVITDLEYATALRDQMRAEVESYRGKIAAETGRSPDQIVLR